MKKFFCVVLAVVFCTQAAFASASSGDAGGSVAPDVDAFVSAAGSVDGHIGVTAYLGAHGIFLSANADMQNYGEFSAGLDTLWDDFAEAAGEGLSNLADMSVSLVRGGLALTKKQWDLYARFGNWLISKFDLGDNQQDVELKDDSVVDDSALLSTTTRTRVGDGYYRSSNYNTRFTDGYIQLYDVSNTSISLYGFYRGSGSSYVVSIYNAGDEPVWPGVKLYCVDDYGPVDYNVGPGKYIYPGQSADTYVHINANFNTAFIKTSGTTITPPDSPGDVTSDALLVDTGTIQAPQEIPDDATGSSSVGGILIPALGAGLGGAAGALAGTISSAVMDGALPDIDLSPADVRVSPDVEVDSDGRIRPADLEINASDIFLDTGNYMLDDLRNYFPFSIPWDLMAFASGFRAEPETPVVNFVLDMPTPITDIEIIVDLSPWDSVAALCREGLYVLFCIRWLMFLYRKFS